jgi:hypothetical protein
MVCTFKGVSDPEESGVKRQQLLADKRQELTKEKKLQEKRLTAPESESRFRSLCVAPLLALLILADVLPLSDQVDNDFEGDFNDDFHNNFEDEMTKNC